MADADPSVAGEIAGEYFRALHGKRYRALEQCRGHGTSGGVRRLVQMGVGAFGACALDVAHEKLGRRNVDAFHCPKYESVSILTKLKIYETVVRITPFQVVKCRYKDRDYLP